MTTANPPTIETNETTMIFTKGKEEMSTTNAITINNVYKRFGKPSEPFWKNLVKGHSSNGNSNGKKAKKKKEIIALDHVSFDVREGEIFGVLGPNGSGKSTLIRLIATLMLPDGGNIQVFNHDAVRQSMKVQQLINRVSVEASFFKKLSPMENLIYGARLYGLEGRETRVQVVKILKRLGLEERSIYSPMEEMSRGMQQKVAIARALLSKPKVLLLDEPTTGLDPRSKRDVQDIVEELNRDSGTTILLTTHDMTEADNLCTRVAIIDGGKIVALDTPEALKKIIPKNGLEPTLEDVFLELTGKKLVKEDEDE
ncbi:MAG: ABC transporter ATP-binding protein [Anaerolineales bacterium]|nr:ABC transporter ATP-binding protein [Anaerolineales bacterium]